jgi:D-alanyl-D-alanine carboxypeptidase
MKYGFSTISAGTVWKVSVVSLAFLLFSHRVHAYQATPISDEQFARMVTKIQTRLDAERERVKFPGASVGFVLPDGRSTSISTGVADRERRIPLKPSDRMPAGSIGKTFVAAAVLMLVQDGKLSLDDKIEYWLGGEKWFSALPNAKDITVRMLLNHSSGIPNHVDEKAFLNSVFKRSATDIKYEELLTYILNKKPLFPAGKGYNYADTNYIIVAMIIERASGRTPYDLVDERIIRPLKLERTIPSNSLTLPETANGYFENKPVIVNGKFRVNPQWEWAGGGFASTTSDLARWAKALYEGQVLPQPLLDQMLSSTSVGEGASYGLGVEITQTKFGKAYGHGGEFFGYLSDMKYFPKYGFAAAIQINADGPDTITEFAESFAEDIAQLIVGELTSAQLPEADKQRLQQLAIDWLKLIDDRRFADSWNGISTALQTKYPQNKWPDALQPLLDKAGKLRKRELKSIVPIDTQTVAVDFVSSFTKAPTATETLILKFENGDNWRVASYTIK